jgi:hypothetical protein
VNQRPPPITDVSGSASVTGPAQRGEAVRHQRGGEVVAARARADPHGAGGRVDPHVAQVPGAHQHAVGGHARAVPGRLHADREPLGRGDLHGPDHVVDGTRGHHPLGPVGDDQVVARDLVVVAGVGGAEEGGHRVLLAVCATSASTKVG